MFLVRGNVLKSFRRSTQRGGDTMQKILSRVKALHRKSRNIVTDWCWKFAKHVVLKAL